MIYLCLRLFLTFFLIGITTFGGGYATLSLIQSEIVYGNAWISESTFTDIVAISQMTPGPIGINCATYVGYEVMRNAGGGYLLGIIGSFVATVAIVLPSFIIILSIAKIYQKFMNTRAFKTIMAGLRPTVIGLIGAAALVLMFSINWEGVLMFSSFKISVLEENFLDWKSWGLFSLAFLVSFFFDINPILIILAGGVAGFLLY